MFMALLIRMSTLPNFSKAFAARFFTSASSVMLVLTNRAVPGPFSSFMTRSVSFPAVSFRSATTTLAPAQAMARA